MDRGTLKVTHTAYRGKLRDFGKTQKALRTVHLPEGLVNELWLWKQECPDHFPEAFIFPNARKRNGAKKNGFIRTENYRARVLAKVATELGLPKLNFQVLRRTMATLAQTKGGVKDVQGVLRSQQGRHHGECLHAADRSQRQTNARRDLLGADGTESEGWPVKTVRKFGTVWYGRDFRWPASDRIKRLGRLTQR